MKIMSKFRQLPPRITHSLKPTMIYFVLGFLWILFSDKLLAMLTSDHAELAKIGLIKGMSFIAVTTILFFLLTYRYASKLTFAEEKIKESHRGISSLLSNLPGMAYRCLNVKDWTMEFVSDGCFELTGYQASDLKDNNIISYAQLIDPEDRQRVWETVQNAIEKKKSYWVIYLLIDRNNVRKRVWEQGTGIYDDNGELKTVEGFITDISELERIRTRVDRLNIVLNTLHSINQLIVREKSVDSLIEKTCDILVSMRGYDSARFAVINEAGEFYHVAENSSGVKTTRLKTILERDQNPPCFQAAMKKPGIVFIGDGPELCPACLTDKEYQKKRKLTICLEHEGRKYGFLCVSMPAPSYPDDEECDLITDITDDLAYALHKIELENKRLEARRELDWIFNLSLDIICIADYNGYLKRYNPAAEKLLGYDESEYVGKSFLDLAHPSDIESMREELQKVSEGKSTVSFRNRLRHKDGSYRWFAWTTVPIAEEGLLFSIGRDITKQWQTYLELQESEARFRNLVENSIYGISIIRDRQVIYQNPAQEKLLGSLPRPNTLLDYENVHPDDVESIKKFIDSAMSAVDTAAEVNFRYYQHYPGDDHATMKWFLCRASAIKYERQQALLLHLVDLTKTRELERIVSIQDKMSSLGHVAAGIAHEIRNPLSGINIYLDTLEKIHARADSGEKVVEIITQLKSASRKIESVIRRVMDFSRPGEPRFIMIDINDAVREAVELSKVTLRKSNIRLECRFAENLQRCRADSQLIEELVLNLVNNAVQAMMVQKEEKKIIVETAAVDNNIEIIISDSGPGVPPQMRDKIFEPFFTSKQGGTGIGLSICLRIASDHMGRISVSSGELGGAEFKIEIPVKTDVI